MDWFDVIILHQWLLCCGCCLCCPSPLQISLTDFLRFKRTSINSAIIRGNAPLPDTLVLQVSYALAGREHKYTSFNFCVNYPRIKVLSKTWWLHWERTDVMFPNTASLGTQGPYSSKQLREIPFIWGWVLPNHLSKLTSYEPALCDWDLCHILKKLTLIIAACPVKEMFSNTVISWPLTQMWHSKTISLAGGDEHPCADGLEK